VAITVPQLPSSTLTHILLPSRRHTLRWAIPILLVLLFLTTLIWLPRQAQQMESGERQEQLIADSLWVEQAIRFQLSRDDESMRLIASEEGTIPQPPQCVDAQQPRILPGHLVRRRWQTGRLHR
jgi:hypothetical protein